MASWTDPTVSSSRRRENDPLRRRVTELEERLAATEGLVTAQSKAIITLAGVIVEQEQRLAQAETARGRVARFLSRR